MKNVKIKSHWIGKQYPVFVIAEAGINHNGSYKLAKKMVDVAKRANATCIKFQTHITEKEMIKTNIRPGNISRKTLWSIIKNCELTESEEENLMKYCKEKKILFLSTPFSKEAVDRLEKIDMPAYKIGSGELTNLPFLEHVAKTKKPIILSTGMSTLKEIKESVNLIKRHNIPLVLLQTTSTYPTDYKDVRLGAIEELERMFAVPVGISDHSLGIYVSLGAVAKGACIVEKHFTLDKKMPGPDQGMSLNPNELMELVKGCQAVKMALSSNKTILRKEIPILRFARESVVSVRDIRKGEELTSENIFTKRPGTGEIPAKEYFKIIGKKAKRDISNDKQLSWKDVS